MLSALTIAGRVRGISRPSAAAAAAAAGAALPKNCYCDPPMSGGSPAWTVCSSSGRR